MTFHVGQKVVCIYRFLHPRYYGLAPPNSGEIYTVSRLTVGASMHGIHLAECPSNNPFGWAAYRFRPVVERKTDISFAHEILRKTSHGADA